MLRPQTEGRKHRIKGRQTAYTGAAHGRSGHGMFWTFRSFLQTRWRATLVQAGASISSPNGINSTQAMNKQF